MMLFLPGLGDRLGVFKREGFHQIAKRFPKIMGEISLVELDAHFGYYPHGELVGRVKADVLERYPDHKISVVGTSLGGFGAQVIARHFPDRISPHSHCALHGEP